jgi:hypothetical protein
MRFSFRSVLLDEIDVSDERFRISTPPESIDDLADAIDRIGLLHPPILYEKADGCIIVAGFRRIEAYRRLKKPAIDARFMPAGSHESDCLKVAVSDNTAHRSLNLMEQSIALSKFSAYCDNDLELSRTAKTLGIPVNPELVRKLIRIRSLSVALQTSILSGAVPLSIALGIDAMDDGPLADRLIAVFEQLRPTLNQQKEILRLIQDLSRMDPVTGAKLLTDEACREVLTDTDLDRPRKIRRLTDVLKRRRFPVISAFQDQYRKMMRKLDLADGMAVLPPEDFEEDRCRMVLDFCSLSQLDIQIDALRALARNPDFQAMINKDFADFNPLH